MDRANSESIVGLQFVMKVIHCENIPGPVESFEGVEPPGCIYRNPERVDWKQLRLQHRVPTFTIPCFGRDFSSSWPIAKVL